MEDPAHTAPLPPDVRLVVAEAAAVVDAVCDDLRGVLLGHTGTIASRAKVDGSPVTEADLVADRTIRAALTEAFPEHQIISEEGATDWDGRDWAWVVDPIDGTSNFTAGIPYWCVSLALTHRGEPVFGCVEAPPLEARFVAVRGEGATRNGEPIAVMGPVDFRDGRHSHVPIVVSAGTIRRGSRTVRLNARILGAGALDLAMVAAGSLVAAYHPIPKVWDVAAGQLLVEEAGGCYVPLETPLLPLEPGADQGVRSAAGIAGADSDWLRDLAVALGVTPRGRGRPPSA